MHCRLPQQIPCHQKIGRIVSRKLNHHNKSHICQIWHTPKLMSDADTNIVSEKFWQFCKTINVKQAVSLAYHHQSNGQVEACTSL